MKMEVVEVSLEKKKRVRKAIIAVSWVLGVCAFIFMLFRWLKFTNTSAAEMTLQYYASKEDYKSLNTADNDKAIRINLGRVPAANVSTDWATPGYQPTDMGFVGGDPITWWVVGSNGDMANIYSSRALFCATKYNDYNSSSSYQHAYEDSWGCNYGKDSSGNDIKPSGGRVYDSHYGGSYIRNTILRGLEGENELFKKNELDLIEATEIRCWDNKEQKSYTVKDKLYLPSRKNEDANMTSGTSESDGGAYIYVPHVDGDLKKDDGSMANSTIPLNKIDYKDAGRRYCWLRSIYGGVTTDGYRASALIAYYTNVSDCSVGSTYFGLAPACKINLESLIFSSAARSAATTASEASGGEILTGGVHNIRLSDSSINEDGVKYLKSYDSKTVRVEVENVPDGYYLMVQGVKGTNNYACAKKIENGQAEINILRKSGDGGITLADNFEGAKVWIERGTGDGQLLYAGALGEISSSTDVIQPTINSTSTSVTYAPGLKLSAVSLPSVTGTPGTWSWDSPDSAVGNAGTHSFNATFTPTDVGYYPPTVTKSITVTVTKATLSASNFSYTAPANIISDGSKKEATVTANSDITGIGTITVNYYDSTGNNLSSAPTEPGMYTVKINVAEGDNYVSATDLSDNWGFKIMRMDTDTLYGGNDTGIKYGQVVTIKELDLPIGDDLSIVAYGWYKGSSNDPNSSDWVQLNSELSYRCKKEDVGSYLMFQVKASNGDVYSRVCSGPVSATTVNDIATAKSQIGSGNNGIMVDASTIGISEIEVNDVQDLLLASVIVDCGKSDLNIKFNCTELDMTNQNYIPLGSMKNPYVGTITGNNCTIKGYQHGVFTGTIDESTKAKLSGINNAYDQYAGLVGCMQGGSISGLTMESPVLEHKNYVGTFVGFAKDCQISNCSVNNPYLTARGECVGGIVAAISGARVDWKDSTGQATSSVKNCKVIGGKATAKKIIGGIVGDGYNTEISGCNSTMSLTGETNGNIVANDYNCKAN